MLIFGISIDLIRYVGYYPYLASIIISYCK